MKLPIRNIKNVHLRRSAIVPAFLASILVTVVIGAIAIALEVIKHTFLSFCEAMKFECLWWADEFSGAWRVVKMVWSKDFTND